MDKKPILEACVETVEQAILAEKCGADRVELCADLSVGGLTPSKELLIKTINSINLPIMAMARPRSGHFIYNKKEVKEIMATIDLFKSAGIRGVVLGFLSVENEIDFKLTKMIVENAFPLNVTFHKAIDLTFDPVSSAKKLSEIKGIQRILTSGGKATAEEGKNNLIKMQKIVGDALNIIVAGKVTKENLGELHSSIGAKEYHGRRIVF
ncbi:MAG: copper homeostasis protein CutC [Saprospiraceae bacterium]